MAEQSLDTSALIPLPAAYIREAIAQVVKSVPAGQVAGVLDMLGLAES